jgi:hypothetical protein
VVEIFEASPLSSDDRTWKERFEVAAALRLEAKAQLAATGDSTLFAAERSDLKIAIEWADFLIDTALDFGVE